MRPIPDKARPIGSFHGGLADRAGGMRRWVASAHLSCTACGQAASLLQGYGSGELTNLCSGGVCGAFARGEGVVFGNRPA